MKAVSKNDKNQTKTPEVYPAIEQNGKTTLRRGPTVFACCYENGTMNRAWQQAMPSVQLPATKK